MHTGVLSAHLRTFMRKISSGGQLGAGHLKGLATAKYVMTGLDVLASLVRGNRCKRR